MSCFPLVPFYRFRLNTSVAKQDRIRDGKVKERNGDISTASRKTCWEVRAVSPHTPVEVPLLPPLGVLFVKPVLQSEPIAVNIKADVDFT